MKMLKVGIIGGSGLDHPTILKDAHEISVETVYGSPSSPLRTGTINGIEVILVARHGREHTIPPTQVNNRANVLALKEQGCTHIIATTAVGSLRQEIGRGDIVILDQFIDFTRHRQVTFHEKFLPGKMVHTPLAMPFAAELRSVLISSCQELGLKYHPKGTVVTIEGPRFSTKAESQMFRSWGADVINMSIAPEAILANEAGIPYAAVAMSTDYDCWKEDEEPVTWEAILKIFHNNVENVTNLLVAAISQINNDHSLNIPDKNSSLPAVDITLSAIKSSIRTIPHWPKPGVMFRDITTLLLNPAVFDLTIQKFKERYQHHNIEKIAGIESRGFIFATALARELQLPLVLIRKKGKLPAETISQEYTLEYGTDKMEMHKDAVREGEKVLIIDDLLATGGTALAAAKLVEKLGGQVEGIAVVIDLPELKGKEKLKDYTVFNLIEFEGE